MVLTREGVAAINRATDTMNQETIIERVLRLKLEAPARVFDDDEEFAAWLSLTGGM